jgi:iron complex transport system substrate-binding protein
MRTKFIIPFILLLIAAASCNYQPAQRDASITVMDQMGRTVAVPRNMTRVAAMYHFGGQIIYALGQQDKLVEQSLYGLLAKALLKVDPAFAARPKTADGHSINYESLIALKPQCAFVYASFNRSEMKQIENAGIKVIALKGETLEESFAAVRLVAKVLSCEKNGEEYINACQKLISLVHERTKDIPADKRMKVIFTGPRSIYTAATGEMLQHQMLEQAGAINVAAALKGFWGNVSPEQVATWNPDVILLGSTLNTYAADEVLRNTQFQSVKAVRDKRVYVFPSTVGWWDYPAPHCVLGVVWTAKTLYPERFKDVDMLKIADDFYAKYLGHSFTSMGGKL